MPQRKMEHSKTERQKFLEEFEEITDLLRSSADLSDAEYSYLLDCIRRVSNHILRKTPILKERIDSIMNGKILRLRTDEIIEEGLRKGKMEAYIEMVKDGLITLTTAAGRLGMSEDELNKHL